MSIDVVEGVGVILRDYNGRILLQHRDNNPNIQNPDSFALFGGGVEFGESIIDTIVREMKEELDLLVNPEHLRLVKKLGGIGHSYISHIYEYVKPINPRLLSLNGEGQKMVFLSKDQIQSEKKCLPYIKKLFLEQRMNPNNL